MKTWTGFELHQSKITRILENQIVKDKVSHAYLFSGPAGVGKLEIALHLTKRLLCSNPRYQTEPCHQCTNCKRIDSGNHPNVFVIEPDGQSIKIDQIRDLQKEFGYKGMEQGRKIYIIRHCEKMTTQASNGLLKFIEQPANMTTAILLTEQRQKVLPTILSRCTDLTFSPLKPEMIRNHLMEDGVKEQMARIVAYTTNNLEKAKELADSFWFTLTIPLLAKLASVINDYEAYLIFQEEWTEHFTEKDQQQQALDLLLLWYRDLLNIRVGLEDHVHFVEHTAALIQNARLQDEWKINQCIQTILKSKSKLVSNVSFITVMNGLISELQG